MGHENVRLHLARLKTEVAERATRLGYVIPSALRKADCGLVLTSLGQFLGHRVHGKQEWKATMQAFPRHLNPNVDGGELKMPYPGTKVGRSDYAWVDADGRVCAVFEVDGRDNAPDQHLPRARDARVIQQHIKPGEPKNFATNNLFKLSTSVLRKELGFVPPIRAWVLFQIQNPPSVGAKGAWAAQPDTWRGYFALCDELAGATIVGDYELFGDHFLAHISHE